jgi:hypothetical protein
MEHRQDYYLEAEIEKGKGGTVILPAGNFTVSEPIVIPADTKIQGAKPEGYGVYLGSFTPSES